MPNVLDGRNPHAPVRRLTLPASTARPAPRHAQTSSSSGQRWRSAGRLNAAVTVLLLAAAAIVGQKLWQAKLEVDLTYRGEPISNASSMIESADRQFRAAVTADEAVAPDDAACFFGPSERPSAQGPVIVCGPVWFGVSPADEPWVSVSVSYSSNLATVTGAVGELTRTFGEVERQTLKRPDDRRPGAVPPNPEWPASGLRLANGSRIEEPAEVIARADAEIETTAELADPVSVAKDARCYFSRSTTDVGRPFVESDVWCGPVRGPSDNPAEVWLVAPVPYRDGTMFGSVAMDQFDPGDANIRSLPEDSELVAPDGRTPPVEIHLNRPPLAPDHIEIVSGTDLALSDRADRITGVVGDDDVTIRVERLRQIGQDAQSFSAPAGHILLLVQATAERTTWLDAQLVVDGRVHDLPRDLTAGVDGTTLIAVLPVDAAEVDLRISGEGSDQTIALVRRSRAASERGQSDPATGDRP